MPTYRFVCTACGQPFEVVQAMSDERPSVCPSCGGRLDRIFDMPNISAKALYTKGRNTRYEGIKETNLGYDLQAYKRLRDNGLQPAQINGAYDFERLASSDRDVTQFELNYKRIFPSKADRQKVRDGLAMVEDAKASLTEATPK